MLRFFLLTYECCSGVNFPLKLEELNVVYLDWNLMFALHKALQIASAFACQLTSPPGSEVVYPGRVTW